MVSDFVRTVSDQNLSPGVNFGIIARPGYEDLTKYITSTIHFQLLIVNGYYVIKGMQGTWDREFSIITAKISSRLITH